MKLQKNVLLTLMLAVACCAQPLRCMNAQKSLENVSYTLHKVQTYWKPVVGTIAVVGLSYWLWSKYNASSFDFTDTRANLSDIIVETSEDLVETKTPIPTILHFLAHLQLKAQEINDTEDTKEMRKLYQSADTLVYTEINDQARKDILLYNNKQLLRDSKDRNNNLRHLSAKINDWYRNAKLLVK